MTVLIPAAKACPFCGAAEVEYDADTASVVCQRCNATGPCMLGCEVEDDAEQEAAATVAWNRREP